MDQLLYCKITNPVYGTTINLASDRHRSVQASAVTCKRCRVAYCVASVIATPSAVQLPALTT
eukprot:4793253-Prymnesium_polylepis.1